MLFTRRKFLLVCLSLTMLSALPRPGVAQDASPKDPSTKPVKVETIAVLPWSLTQGTDGAKKTAKEFLSVLLTKVKVDAVSEVKTLAAWEETASSEYDTKVTMLPTSAQMLRVGKKLGVDWVMSGSVVWHSRSIWVGLGPKTKSTCTINTRVVDVKSQEVVLDVKDLKMDSTAKEDTLKALGSLFVSGLFTFVSGGPKTPHEQRAVQMGIAKALEPWLAQHLKVTKIDLNSK